MLKTRPLRLLLLAVLSLLRWISLSPHFHSAFNLVSLAAPINKSVRPAIAPKYAFATYLSTRLANESERDPYFTATRVLDYQLLHQPSTRTRQNTPLLVLVPPHVSEAKRQILREEGATVMPVDLLTPSSWTAHPTEERWIDQFTKQRLFSLTAFSRILYMDSDMLLTRPLDDIWDEETVKFPRKTNDNSPDSNSFNLPADYVIAGVTDNERPGRKRPTRITPRSRLNAGFLVFKPDIDLFEYYVSLEETAQTCLR
jgi:alpha-N-acetylglucosamine transferase